MIVDCLMPYLKSVLRLALLAAAAFALPTGAQAQTKYAGVYSHP